MTICWWKGKGCFLGIYDAIMTMSEHLLMVRAVTRVGGVTALCPSHHHSDNHNMHRMNIEQPMSIMPRRLTFIDNVIFTDDCRALLCINSNELDIDIWHWFDQKIRSSFDNQADDELQMEVMEQTWIDETNMGVQATLAAILIVNRNCLHFMEY